MCITFTIIYIIPILFSYATFLATFQASHAVAAIENLTTIFLNKALQFFFVYPHPHNSPIMSNLHIYAKHMQICQTANGELNSVDKRKKIRNIHYRKSSRFFPISISKYSISIFVCTY